MIADKTSPDFNRVYLVPALSGVALGATWYGGTILALTGPAAPLVAGAGAIALATAAPCFLLKRRYDRKLARMQKQQKSKAQGARPVADAIDAAGQLEALSELRDDIWIIDANGWRVSYMNRAAEQRLGRASGDLPQEPLDEFADSAELRDIARACRSLKDNGNNGTHFEVMHRDIPLHVSIKQLRDTTGSTRFLILMCDISDQVAQDQRKSEFISTVSHELRSPLTSIKGALRLLLCSSDLNLPDKALALLEIAHRSSDRLILIINDILDLDKVASGEMVADMRETDVAELVHETYSATQILQDRFDVTVETIGADTPLPFVTDPNRFIQVLTNLLSNACKFSPQGGRVTVEIRDSADHLRVSVRDEGGGIPASDQYKIFQRFADMPNSDRAAKGGTGLGLSICKAIVEGMGGTIGFQSREGAGTDFYFTLPKAALNSHMAHLTAADDTRPGTTAP
ncbi:PAS domain-containing sensor histidine kinase [Roseovarius arcticus]|uniref:PAS domain-containing sensor histidine kinase n=1 Tax=Roseovarius arcticus TaxID=2547404 RepID=UPI0011100BA1|nr:PAS domain-containing sensor histidine kinase [Roseovarius arcticus]